MTAKQGIVAVLGSDHHDKTVKAASLRRTLSADMSSKRWMAQNDLCLSPPPLKKIASSEHISSLLHVLRDSSSDEEDEDACDKVTAKQPRQVDVWTAILSQKAQESRENLPPPYIHPLVRKSSGSLSKTSLEVCTESLGSETGSDVFSSPAPASREADDNNKDVQQEEENKEEEIKDMVEPKVVKNSQVHPTTKKAQQARSLPPPLASLTAAKTDGPSLHMHSRRVDGRLVLEAVSVPTQKYFEAQRQDGRFLLTLINDPNEEKSDETQEDDEIITNFQEKDVGILREQEPNLTVGAIKLHKSTVIMKKISERDNRNLSWSSKLNYKHTAPTTKSSAPPPVITHSLPPRIVGLPPLPPPPAAAASVNSYQYFWRAKPSVASVIDPLITQHTPPTKNKLKAYEQKEVVVMRGNKADCLLPSLKSCKEPRRSLLMWEPFCIATS